MDQSVTPRRRRGQAATIDPGTRFGTCVVVGTAPPHPERGEKWGKRSTCLCDCGVTFEMWNAHLLKRVKDDQRKTEVHRRCLPSHGTRGTSPSEEYNVWNAMRSRCNNPRVACFSNYGGRGISVCQRWESFSNFIADMGRRPSPNHTIERVDNNGNYSPENCKWVTRREQSLNTRRSALVEFEGQRFPIADMAAICGLRPGLVIQRRGEYGWPETEWFRPARPINGRTAPVPPPTRAQLLEALDLPPDFPWPEGLAG